MDNGRHSSSKSSGSNPKNERYDWRICAPVILSRPKPDKKLECDLVSLELIGLNIPERIQIAGL
jgi:hypothetical protein